jgi:hypothetical protein
MRCLLLPLLRQTRGGLVEVSGWSMGCSNLIQRLAKLLQEPIHIRKGIVCVYGDSNASGLAHDVNVLRVQSGGDLFKGRMAERDDPGQR